VGFVIVNLHVNHFVSWNKRLGDLFGGGGGGGGGAPSMYEYSW